MIDLEGIRTKAENAYRPCVTAFLTGDESFFPFALRADLSPGEATVSELAASIRELRNASRESVGYGFTIEWQEINSRRYGRNVFPRKIVFPTREDLLRFLGKTREFATLTGSVSSLRAAFPELETWIRSNPQQLLDVAADIDGLIEVCRYFRDHPRPGIFAREFPLGVDTKFVERGRSTLRAWLDRILPSHAIRADEEQFERRFGVRYAEPHVLLRLLDSRLIETLGLPCDELSLPIRALDALPARCPRVVIVENKISLLTLPPLPDALALGGLGRAVTMFRDIRWLKTVKIDYWGDIDVSGFEILSALRAAFPQTRSLLMDAVTLETWRRLTQAWIGKSNESLPHLTTAEEAAYSVCRLQGLRLEQERLPLSVSNEALTSSSPSLDP